MLLTHCGLIIVNYVHDFVLIIANNIRCTPQIFTHVCNYYSIYKLYICLVLFSLPFSLLFFIMACTSQYKSREITSNQKKNQDYILLKLI